jgi:hypothetical protein
MTCHCASQQGHKYPEAATGTQCNAQRYSGIYLRVIHPFKGKLSGAAALPSLLEFVLLLALLEPFRQNISIPPIFHLPGCNGRRTVCS